MALNIKGLFVTHNISDIQHIRYSAYMILSISDTQHI
jgi:hypothetical protein